MTKKADYKWTTTLPPVQGVPMYDHKTGSYFDEIFVPRDSYGVELTKIYNKVVANKESYIRSFVRDPSAEDNKIIERLIAASTQKTMLIFNPDENINLQELDQEINALSSKLEKYFPDTRAVLEEGLEQYDRQYKTIDKPFTADHLHQNDTFAYARVAGSNPVALRGITRKPDNFPLTEEQYQSVMGSNDSLSQALSQKRIYMVNYSYLSDAVAEDGYTKPEIGGSAHKVHAYSYAAMALFAVSKVDKKLTAVAIQCGQDPDDDNPMFLACDESDQEHFWGWERAKYIIQAADESEHQLSTHLGLTHLIGEAFALATIRKLPENHKIYKLLISHFEGTNRVNHNATLQLLGPGQFVDTLFAAPLGKLANKVIEIRLGYDFYEHFLPTELKNRGVDDINAFPDYPYRDDGLLIWNAINNWVYDYIFYSYETDKLITTDDSLNEWMDDIVLNGKVHGFRKVKTRAELVDVLTMIIFTCSAQHAAVNFTQPPWLMYAPFSCGTMPSEKPKSVTGNSRNTWLQTLPGLARAEQKIGIYTLLGELHNGYLGEYVYRDGKPIFPERESLEIDKRLKKFRDELKVVSETIRKRNGSRPYSYTSMVPENIPASINI